MGIQLDFQNNFIKIIENEKLGFKILCYGIAHVNFTEIMIMGTMIITSKTEFFA